MNFIFIQFPIYLIITAFIIRTIRNAFYLSFLWQLKEYRLDRMLVHLKTTQGKKLIFGPITLSKWLLLIFIFMSFMSEYALIPNRIYIFDIGLLGLYAYILFAVIWILEAILNILEVFTKGWRMPVFTSKILITLGAIFVFEFNFLFFGNIVAGIFYGPFYDKALAPLVSLLMLIFSFPTFLYRKLIIFRARKKILLMRNLIVIGITGSYGKTSAKEFLATILSEKYKVAKTPESSNTDIGIAQYIVKELQQEHEILVVEMGAYKRGEIADICNFVYPKIGIITGINEQHIELFGSIENTMMAKFELISHLVKGGHAIINIDNKYTLEMIKWAKEKRPDLDLITYSRNKLNNGDLMLFASDVKVTAGKITFVINYMKKKVSCETRLTGIQNVDNILAAVAVAYQMGMTNSQIQMGIKKIKSPDKTMKVVGKIGNLILIDDSYNANPDGVLAAIDYMRLFSGKKILVLTPLIELGKEADRIHRKLGKIALKYCDLVLLTNLNYHDAFITAASKLERETKIVPVSNIIMAKEMIMREKTNQGIVVFEGKEAGKILDILIKTETVQ